MYKNWFKEPLVNQRESVGAALAAMGQDAFIAAKAAPTLCALFTMTICAAHQRFLNPCLSLQQKKNVSERE